MENSVVTSGVLDCPPFPVTYKSVARSVPDHAVNSGNDTIVLTNNVAHPHVSVETINNCINSMYNVNGVFITNVAISDNKTPSTDENTPSQIALAHLASAANVIPYDKETNST